MKARSRLPLPPLPDLAAELQRLVSLIPQGSVTTYGDLARALGSRHAAISVSQWAREQMERRPRGERRVVGLKEVGELNRFSDFPEPKPLAPLETWLKQAAEFVNERPLRRMPRTIAGVDVAYPSPKRAVAAAVLVDVRSRSVIHELVIERPVEFPYITGFLTFRELPVMLAACEALIEKAGRPDVVMVDGQGRLHPHRGGVATGFAAASGLPTIGVAKSLLCGKVEAPRGQGVHPAVERVLVGEEHLGYALRTTPGSSPIYLSVGGWLSLEDALNATLSVLTTTRLPLPTHRADRLSKKNWQ